MGKSRGKCRSQQVLDFLKQNEVQVREIEKGKREAAPNPAKIAAIESEIAKAEESARQADAAAAESGAVKEGDRVATVGAAPSRGGYSYSEGRIYEATRVRDGSLRWKLAASFGGTRSGRSDRFIAELKNEAANRGMPWLDHVRNNDPVVSGGADAAKAREAAGWHAEVARLGRHGHDSDGLRGSGANRG